MDEESQLFAQALTVFCTMRKTASPVLHNRFRQLLQQTFSSDSILQLITPAVIPLMLDYAKGEAPDDRLTAFVPALGMVFRNLQSPQESHAVVEAMHNILRPFCRLLASRARNIFDDLVLRREVILASMLNPCDDDNFEETGCYYGKPPCRARPFYEGKDIANEKSIKDEGTCRKLYSTYTKNNLTGGLMALWCPHLICLGFHKIPVCEGRNDVFSAILRYWEHAPDVVIYDFACQLGPYCMQREPEFFKDTLFVVDEMHANGHTQCSQACFISNYMNVRSRLMGVNSSTAKTSNSRLNRIRKSVSYMGQSHAILFTYVYLSVWNRKKELELKQDLQKQLSTL